MKYVKYKPEYFDELVKMSCALFPNEGKKEMKKWMRMSIESKRERIYFAVKKGKPVAFIITALRFEYVEGAQFSPTGYIEAVYVKPKYRKKGVARELYATAEKWVASKGCKQIGSDTWDWNKDSIKFHKKVGFKVEDILVHFIKDVSIKG